ncbi:diacylglycerol/lipid kinase family protein [Pseudoalteromonas sp. MTN2-4]|uniref:diacylglycerol/lipid kinase family protein n=1 Tax=Pseudoalteromonas sp. MTN2-4 TaxID=3056555 RepID=UPI0036F2A6B9
MLVVVKPSDSPFIEAQVQWIKEECVKRGLKNQWFFTSGCFETDVAAIKKKLAEVETVVAVGGDGTLHLVANALANSSVSLAVLPAGTGNDFVRQFGYSKQQWRALIFSESYRLLDLGKINQRFFINVAGIGFNAAVVKDMNTFQIRHKLSYIFAGIKHLFSFKHTSSHDPSFMRVFANGQFFAAGLKVAPSARIDNGKLLMLHFRAESLMSRLWSFLLMLVHQHEKSSHLDVSELMEYEISVPGLLVEADGEMIGETPAVVKVCRGALKMRL